jgi:hypothetical protein
MSGAIKARRLLKIETAAWPTVDLSGFDKDMRAGAENRALAIQLYERGTPLATIARTTGLSRQEVSRLFTRCQTVAPDGRIYGFRAILPGTRIKGYTRSAPVVHARGDGSGGCSGAFTNLLTRFHGLAKFILNEYIPATKKRKEQHAKISVANLHGKVITWLKDHGLADNEWPLNTQNEGLESLRRYCNTLIETHEARWVKGRAGANAAMRNKIGRGVPSIRAFFKHFLKTVGECNLSGETYDLRLRLENALIDCGRNSSMKSVVLLIDEAQEMALQDFQFLKDIGNQLEEEGVQLVVIMMGQDPEFTAVIAKLKLAGRLDLISRFTLRHILFRGLSTECDIQAVLNAIDHQEYPIGSGCAWPQAFVPIAWIQGFRMVDQTAKLVHVLKEHLPMQTLANGVSARQFFLAIRRFVIDYADLEIQGKALPDDLWHIAVEYALVEDAAEIAAQNKRKHRARVRL